eukprot:5950056-Prymnesium_polylepis.1
MATRAGAESRSHATRSVAPSRADNWPCAGRAGGYAQEYAPDLAPLHTLAQAASAAQSDAPHPSSMRRAAPSCGARRAARIYRAPYAYRAHIRGSIRGAPSTLA